MVLSDLQLAMFSSRVRELEVASPGFEVRFSRLQGLLLPHGGLAVVPLPDLSFPGFVGALLSSGVWFPHETAVLEPMAVSSCHANARCLVRSTRTADGRAVVGWACGFALSDDGLWRQHSWAMSDVVVETTLPRLGYFGMEMAPSR